MYQNLPKVEGGSQDLASMHNIFLPKIPSEHLSSQLSNQSFGRQDSLSFCATLQDADRNRQENIMDFMEREMDLNEYIGAIRDLDVPPDHIDLDDMELQKAHILYDDGQMDQYAHDPYAHRPDLRVPQQPGSSDRSLASTPNFVHVKTEDEEDWEYEPTTSTSTAPPRRRLTRDPNDMGNYTPKTKARKYILKPDEEKKNPVYKLKRARNNDAVRKSRSKQKELQASRDRELDELRNQVTQLKAELNLARRLNEEQKVTIARMARR